MGQEGANTQTFGIFCEAVIHVTVLFELETWVITPKTRRILRGFHHRVARHLSGMKL